MRIFEYNQITTLTTAIGDGFPGEQGQSRVRMILGKLGIDFAREMTPGASFELTLLGILQNLNTGGGLDALFRELQADPRVAVSSAIAAMLAAPPPPRAVGFDDLTKERLLIDGQPFINHDILANTIMPRLMDRNDLLRAVIMTGPTDSGKTFSVPLIRRLCRDAPMAQRFRPVLIDLMATALTRDCMEVARTVSNGLAMDRLELPSFDTSEPRIGRRLVDKLSIARELSVTMVVPTILIFDHLDKDVAPSIVDFVEELALAAADSRLQDLRVVLIGFPRAPSTTFELGKVESDIVVQPNPALLFEYIDRALSVLDRDMDDQTLQNLVNGIFAGAQQPYPRPFMIELPGKIRRVLNDIIRAPTT